MTAEIIAALIKAGGAVIGAFLALIFQPPKTLAEFWTRSAFSVVSGAVFGERMRDWLKWPMEIETGLASAALTALLSWWMMGAAVRVIGAWRQK